MKANKKVMAALLAAMMTVSAGAAVVSAADAVAGPGDSTVVSTNGQWYRYPTKNGYRFAYKNADGTWAQGWKMIGGSWYFFAQYDNDGNLYTTDVATGSSQYEYYALMDTGVWCKDSAGGHEYRFDKNGKMITGWYQTTGTDAMDPSQSTTAGNWEYYGTNGARAYGWYKDGANWYYTIDGVSAIEVFPVNSDGTLGANINVSTNKGKLLMGGTYRIDGVIYTFADNGVMQNQGQGWVKNGKDWYYMENNAYVHASYEGAADGWKLINGKYYYFGANAKMRTGWHSAYTDATKYKAVWYYCTPNGDLVMNNWVQMSNGDWYLVNASGEMLTGWQVRGGKTYLLSTATGKLANIPLGKMVTGTRVEVADGMYATFDASGALISLVNEAGESVNVPR